MKEVDRTLTIQIHGITTVVESLCSNNGELQWKAINWLVKSAKQSEHINAVYNDSNQLIGVQRACDRHL
jgi:hypothetical protein